MDDTDDPILDLKTKLKMYEGARELIKEPRNWCKGAYAMKYDHDEFSGRDRRIPSSVDEGECFCLVGACARALYDIGRTMPFYTVEGEVIELDACVREKVPTILGVISFNDNGSVGHNDVLEALDCAIENVKLTIGEQ